MSKPQPGKYSFVERLRNYALHYICPRYSNTIPLLRLHVSGYQWQWQLEFLWRICSHVRIVRLHILEIQDLKWKGIFYPLWKWNKWVQQMYNICHFRFTPIVWDRMLIPMLWFLRKNIFIVSYRVFRLKIMKSKWI